MWDVPLLDPRALLLEKECVLVESFYGGDFPENENCLFVTGRGIVNEQTRAFMKYFSQYHRNGTTDLKIQGLTDMGQEGACIIAYLDNSFLTRPFAPHEAFNIRVGWIGLNDRFMRNAFPQHTYVETSTANNDTIINNRLLDIDNGFVTSNNHNDRRRRQVTRLLSNEALGSLNTTALNYRPNDPRGRKVDIDVLDEDELMNAVKIFLSNPGMLS